MDAAIFSDAPLGLGERSPLKLDERVDYRADDDLVFMNFEGLTLETLEEAEALAEFLGRWLHDLGSPREPHRQLRQLRARERGGAAVLRDGPGARAVLFPVLHALLDRCLPSP